MAMDSGWGFTTEGTEERQEKTCSFGANTLGSAFPGILYLPNGSWLCSICSRISARMVFLCIFPPCSQCSLWCHSFLAWAECRLILVGGFTTEYTEGTEEIQKKDAQFRSLYAWLRCSRASLFEAMKVGLIQFGPAVQPGSISSVFFLRVLGVLCGAFLLGPGLRGDGYCFGGRYPSPGICKLR